MAVPITQEENDYPLFFQMDSRHGVLDLSGGLPFYVAFGLSRRYGGSNPDTDPRPILLDTSGSMLDIPYALANGLLTLPEFREGPVVDMSDLVAEPSEHKYITIAPGTSRHTPSVRNESYEIYLGPIEAGSKVTQMLRSGTKYQLKLATRDLHVRWWAFGERSELIGDDGKPRGPRESSNLTIQKWGGSHAEFMVKDSVSLPPKVAIALRSSHEATSDAPSPPCIIETSITNNDARPVTFQHSGEQYFNVPHGPWGLLEDVDTRRTRIGSTDEARARRSLTIRKKETGEIVFGGPHERRAGCQGLTRGSLPKILHRSQVATLEPDVPFVNHYDLTDVIAELPDGVYQVRLEPLGAWWAWGSADELGVEDGKVPEQKLRAFVVPMQLDSEHVVELNVVGGKSVPLSV